MSPAGIDKFEHERSREPVIGPPLDESRPHRVVQNILDDALELLVLAKKMVPKTRLPERAYHTEPPRFALVASATAGLAKTRVRRLTAIVIEQIKPTSA